jgi:hypothetical protein
MEILRRLLLLCGLCGFLWCFFDSPPVLLRVRPVDFAREMMRRPAVLGIPDTPPDLQEFVIQKTRGRRIDVEGPEWEKLAADIAQSAGPEAPAPDTDRTAGGFAYFMVSDPPLAKILQDIRSVYAASQSVVSYIALSGKDGRRFLEVWYETRPRQLDAPRHLLYPRRAISWWFLAAGILLYALLPWPVRADNAAYCDAAGVIGLDVLGNVIAVLFFGVSLYAADSTQALLGEDLGRTVFLWFLALGGVGLQVWAACNAAFRVKLIGGGLHVSRLGRPDREILFHELARATYLKKAGMNCGIALVERDGGILKLKWGNLLHFERVLHHLSGAGFRVEEPGEAAHFVTI